MDILPEISDTELMVLGLVAEMPRHGYELEQIIEQRMMREWTPIGFSSIYYLLGKLENRALIKVQKSRGREDAGPRATRKASPGSGKRPVKNSKDRKVFQVLPKGLQVLKKQTLHSLRSLSPNHSSLTKALKHWSYLSKEEALDALQDRLLALRDERERLERLQLDQQPLPDYENAMFDFALRQLKSEYEWVKSTAEYMKTRPWS